MAGEPTASYPEFREAYAQTAVDNALLLLLGADDIEFTLSTVGFIFRSANGKRWRLKLSADGIPTTSEVT